MLQAVANAGISSARLPSSCTRMVSSLTPVKSHRTSAAGVAHVQPSPAG